MPDYRIFEANGKWFLNCFFVNEDSDEIEWHSTLQEYETETKANKAGMMFVLLNVLPEGYEND